MHMHSDNVTSAARSSGGAERPISLQSARADINRQPPIELAAAAILGLPKMSLALSKNLENFTTEEVCKWLEKEGVDTTAVADIRGKVVIYATVKLNQTI